MAPSARCLAIACVLAALTPGTASAAQGPVAALRVAASAQPGTPPPVTLSLSDQAAPRVLVRVDITSLASGREVASLALGWLAPGRTLTARWPARVTLAAGAYHVRVLGRDSHGLALQRPAGARGVSYLQVAPAATAPVAPAATTPAAPAAGAAGVGAPTPAQTLADGAVFPVAGAHSFGGPENRYGAPRAGHIHEGQDVLAAEGTPVLVPLAGTITHVAFQEAGAGWYAVEHTGVGLDLMFAHCQAGSLDVLEGQSVAPGARLCRVGQTGDATAPHLHFELWVGGWWAPGGHTIDPLPYLEAWQSPAG